MLKRYLRARYKMSPDEYRRAGTCRPTIRWWRRTMPQRRSDFAKQIGLGKGGERGGKKKKS